MRSFWKRLWVLPVLVVTALVGCEVGNRSPMEVLPASQPVLSEQTVGSNYTLVEESLPEITEAVSASTLIGASGGRVELLGHSLSVPAGAVTEPTLFTLTVLPTGYVEVDLRATVTSLLGEAIDVGGEGFRKPVTVSLTYSRATNVPDPSRLTVVWKKTGYDNLQAVHSKVNVEKQTVTAELGHFSEYILAYP